jgi:hypothetical protein
MVDGGAFILGAMSATVLLTTTMDWPFPAQLAGAFAGAGARVEALCPQDSALSVSRHPRRFYRHQTLSPDASLKNAIAQSQPDLVIPCDDLAAEIAQRVRGAADFSDRHEFLVRAAKAGAPVAHSMSLTKEDGVAAALQKFGLPLVLKRDHSWGGAGVIIAHTRQEALASFQRLRKSSRLRDLARFIRRKETHFLSRALSPVAPAISAQAFIDGHPATSSIACWRGEVVAANHFDVLVTSVATGPACVIARRDCPQMQDTAQIIARTFDLSGLFGLDYVRDRQGRVHLLEINARATPTAHLMLQQDLPAALLKSAGLPARPRPHLTSRDEIAIFPREWLRDPASPWLKNAFHDVPWDDPDVVRACVQSATGADPAAAQALLEGGKNLPLTTKNAVFGG